jgi:hydroxymethylbilane synthase
LAAAGLNVLVGAKCGNRIYQRKHVYPRGQSALLNAGDDKVAELGKLTHQDTWKAVHAERAFLYAMDGGCQVPIAGFATIKNEKVEFTGLVASPDAEQIFIHSSSNVDPEKAGNEVAKELSEQGAYDLIQQVREDLNV